MKAAVFESFGDPAKVLEVRDVPVPEPGRGEVRVRMLASPVNPSDLLYIRGQYGARPQLPVTPGFEGVGMVEATGGGLLGRLRLGRRVAVLSSRSGTWQERTIVPARRVIPVPPQLPDDQAATFFVNPASALVMTHYVLKIPPGACLAQTAAGSALGRMVIRLGQRSGFRTINIVRRPEQADELRRAGAEAVICSSTESIETRLEELTGGKGVPFAIDAVGGSTGSAVARSLASRGRMLLYGTLSGEPLELNPRTLIAGQKRIEGFWLGEWSQAQRVVTMLRLVGQLSRLFAAGVVTSEVGQTFPLTEVQAAVQTAETPGRQGKVLLRISESSGTGTSP
jgi:NADPH:quinone reductase-like Zn-dependent oxidoreductase